jgi:hypothetical protein
MARIPIQETEEPAEAHPTRVSASAGSFLVSVAFWLSLATAVVIYASVALSPKLANWITVRQQYFTNAARLKELEDEADYMESVVAALKADPDFAMRLARQNAGSADFRIDAPTANSKATSEIQQVAVPVPLRHPQVVQAIFHLATHQEHRRWLSMTSALLVLIGFTFLNESGAGMVRAAADSGIRGVSHVIRRYRRPSETLEDSPESPIGDNA